mmetsp:Transcript_17618/g.36488  ORF Transcript_17618/g.36488 Transcript_17618/m.36488 type:complete len:204 (-) Transcript_17618:687-1298(-)
MTSQSFDGVFGFFRVPQKECKVVRTRHEAFLTLFLGELLVLMNCSCVRFFLGTEFETLIVKWARSKNVITTQSQGVDSVAVPSQCSDQNATVRIPDLNCPVSTCCIQKLFPSPFHSFNRVSVPAKSGLHRLRSDIPYLAGCVLTCRRETFTRSITVHGLPRQGGNILAMGLDILSDSCSFDWIPYYHHSILISRDKPSSIGRP